jgi:hypothetical protein
MRVYRGLARKLLEGMADYRYYGHYMSSGHLITSESVARRVRKPKAQKRTRGRRRNGKTGAQARSDYDTNMAAAGTLTRTKALLLAALRVWELKHRIREQE